MSKGENLKPIRTTEEAKRRGKNGGIKSGASRRKKRALKETMAMLLELPVMDQQAAENIKKFGVDIEELNNNTRLMYTLLQKAFSGELTAINEVRKIVDEPEQNDTISFNVVFSDEIKEFSE